MRQRDLGCSTRLLKEKHIQGECFIRSTGALLHPPFRSESMDSLLYANFQWEQLCKVLGSTVVEFNSELSL